ncbi:hypothetical protein SXIM_08520 [Streptomyces xiamenensis]|uniref:Uncharacterized protein n=1 Tax=Streptomyces xiamenensis TaxID=408015 RepID=A0A0F7CN38_9ACTN|nr:hypothetical protein SXIM_08520 [Streptomyces xiamenensis]
MRLAQHCAFSSVPLSESMPARRCPGGRAPAGAPSRNGARISR